MFARFFVATLFAVIASGGLGQAQAPKKGPNGGTVVTSQGHPIEFVNNEQEVVFYIVDDDGTPMSTKNFQGRAVIQDQGKTATVTLSPAEPNKMVGKLQAPLGTKSRVAMSVTFAAGGHKHTLQARFTTN
jgi:hypothetical protein